MPKTPHAALPEPLWTVTCTPGAPLAPITRALRAAGLQVTDVLDAISVVNGHAPAQRLAALRAVPGVADVAPTLGFQIGPDDGPQ